MYNMRVLNKPKPKIKRGGYKEVLTSIIHFPSSCGGGTSLLPFFFFCYVVSGLSLLIHSFSIFKTKAILSQKAPSHRRRKMLTGFTKRDEDTGERRSYGEGSFVAQQSTQQWIGKEDDVAKSREGQAEGMYVCMLTKHGKKHDGMV